MGNSCINEIWRKDLLMHEAFPHQEGRLELDIKEQVEFSVKGKP